ncbi:MAG: hypothetical protein LCH84_07595 [Gemmatimonadetes bacterium]|nr:hypothetical protein [Gemmatimonadota bacterium]
MMGRPDHSTAHDAASSTAGLPVDPVLSAAAARNLSVAMQLRATAWELSAAGVRTFRPELTEAEVQAEVRALFRRTGG